MWYGNGYEDDGMLKTFMFYSDSWHIYEKFEIKPYIGETFFFVDAVTAVFKCKHPVMVNATDQVKW